MMRILLFAWLAVKVVGCFGVYYLAYEIVVRLFGKA